MTNTNNEKIANILANGPLLSGEIIEELKTRYNMTSTSAPKALDRISVPVKKIEGFNFKHNQKFFYLYELDCQNKQKFHQYCDKYSMAEVLILNALESRGGICLAKYLPIASGLPTNNAQNRKLFQDAVESLEKVEMIKKDKDDESEKTFYYLYDKTLSSYSESKFYLAIEDRILEQLKILFVNLNFSSKGAIKVRTDNEIPKYGSCHWSLVGPTYLDGVKRGKLNGFICCDILLGSRINEHNIKPVLKKFELTKFQKRSTRFIPAIFFQSMAEPLLYELRSKGFMTISAKTFGGDELLIALEELRSLYNDIKNNINIGKAEETFKKLIDLKLGIDNNIRGHLFNLMAKVLFDLDYTGVRMEKIVKLESVKREIDVYFEDENYRYIIETKAWSNIRNKDGEIKKWIEEKYYFFGRWSNSKRDSKEIKIYFIVSFRNKDWVKSINEKYKKFKKIEFYDQSFLEEISRRHNRKEFNRILKDFSRISS